MSEVSIRKVLLVDGDAFVRVVGKLSLESVGGWDVMLATTGEEALRTAERERPDLILLADVLPGELDGRETFVMLRNNRLTEEIPVVFTLDGTRWMERRPLDELGANGVVAKPFIPTALPGEIRKLLNGRIADDAQTTTRWDPKGPHERPRTRKSTQPETIELQRVVQEDD